MPEYNRVIHNRDDAMRIEGTLKTWNESKGFGFITPRNGGQEIFVHISEYPRQGGKPRIGEALSFATELNAEGKKKAVKVQRPESPRLRPPAASARAENEGAGLWGRIVPTVIIILMLSAGYKYFAPRLLARTPAAPQTLVAEPNPLDPPSMVPRGPFSTEPNPPDSPSTVPRAQLPADVSRWRCDGRQRCTEMTSCEEAKFFLNNCPGVKMDGDGDGIPCEDQLCGH